VLNIKKTEEIISMTCKDHIKEADENYNRQELQDLMKKNQIVKRRIGDQ
jgi:hypothetical protein